MIDLLKAFELVPRPRLGQVAAELGYPADLLWWGMAMYSAPAGSFTGSASATSSSPGRACWRPRLPG